MPFQQQLPARFNLKLAYKYTEGHFSEYLKELAQEWQVSIQDDTVYCPEKMGNGFIRNLVIDSNCCVRFISLQPRASENLTLFKEVSDMDQNYKLVMHVDSLRKISGNPSSHLHTFLYGNQKIKTVLVPAQSEYTRLVVLFNEIWLESHFPVLTEKLRQLTSDHLSAAGIVTWKPGAGGMYNILQLVTELNRPSFSREQVKSMTCQLMHDLFHKLSHNQDADDPSKSYYSVEQLKQRIETCVNQGWPGIDQLAAEFYMKSSTLKRHFKTVTGFNIYQYFQLKRLEWSKTELLKPGVKIGDVARALGFTKHSNFGGAFKKIYGVTPMEFRKENHTAKS